MWKINCEMDTLCGWVHFNSVHNTLVLDVYILGQQLTNCCIGQSLVTLLKSVHFQNSVCTLHDLCLTKKVVNIASYQHVLLDWFIHQFYPQNGTCNHNIKFHLWLINDGEKWSKKFSLKSFHVGRQLFWLLNL